jgi:hypothetical protein
LFLEIFMVAILSTSFSAHVPLSDFIYLVLLWVLSSLSLT